MSEKHRKPEVASLDTVSIKDNTYTSDQLIAEVKALAEAFPDRRITRDFFRGNSEIPERAWTALFGNFPELLRQADLNYSRYENKMALATSRHASVDHLRELSEDRKNYGETYDRPNKKRFKTIVACSDLHDIECDPFYTRMVCEAISLTEADVVCVAGDLFDCPEFGKYSVDPREWNPVERVRAGVDILRRFREAGPKAQIDLIEGNHEARILKHLVECSPATQAMLSDYHEFDVRKFLKLDELEVNYHALCDLFAFTDHQLKKEVKKNYKVYWKSVLAHHFPEGKNMGMPGFNGHHHKHITWSLHNMNYGSYEWHQLGAGHIRQAPYCDGSKWNNGFMIVNVDTRYGYVDFDYVTVGATFARIGGKFFDRQANEMYDGLTEEMQQLDRGK